MKSPTELTELFRQRGLRVTPQRQRIFQVLAGNQTHPTAESVYAAAKVDMPTLSLKTVYQTLNELVSLGEIQQINLGTGASRFDPGVHQHHHLVCVSCGQVRDLHADYSGLQIPPEQQQGFIVGSAEVIFRGLCETCQRQEEGSRHGTASE